MYKKKYYIFPMNGNTLSSKHWQHVSKWTVCFKKCTKTIIHHHPYFNSVSPWIPAWDSHALVIAWEVTTLSSLTTSILTSNEWWAHGQITPTDCKLCRLDFSVCLIWAHCIKWVKKTETRQLNFGLDLMCHSEKATTVFSHINIYT